MCAEREANATDEIEITPEMIVVGESVILGEVGGAPIGGPFSASDLAREVYVAMERLRLTKAVDRTARWKHQT